MLDFNRLQTPPGDGDFLIEPPPARWPEMIFRNIRLRREYRFTFAGEPAAVAISETRAALIDQGPVIAAGHQPAFIHPGVWAKHVVVHHAAHSFGVEGLDFVVDNDAPPSAGLTLPTITPEGVVALRDIAFSSASTGSAYEGRPPLKNDRLETIANELSDLIGPAFADSPLASYLGALHGPRVQTDWVDQHLTGRYAVDLPLNADLPEARVSTTFGGLFMADLLLNPQPFAVAYNQALTRYRENQGITGSDRPLPDLRREADRTETALWIYQPMHRRRRLWVRRAADAVEVFADGYPVGTLPARELAHRPDEVVTTLRPWVIRPRALTLTLWARLLACDLFVHGIGGAKYDRITDDIIRRYYRSEPPGYICVSATLRLPLPHFDATVQQVARVARALRDWHFNPQRYLSHPPADKVDERARLIARSDALRAVRAASLERGNVYRAIRRANARLTSLEPHREAEWERQIARLELELRSNQVSASREYFYCLQPGSRLASLAGRLKDGW